MNLPQILEIDKSFWFHFRDFEAGSIPIFL